MTLGDLCFKLNEIGQRSGQSLGQRRHSIASVGNSHLEGLMGETKVENSNLETG